MTILVDPAIWPWRGDHWAHLISDVSEIELHNFAERLNVRRLSFQGDHYDISVATRQRALDLGAAPITSRELVSRLRAGGLRRREKTEPWDKVLSRHELSRDTADALADQPVSGTLRRAVTSLVNAGVEGVPPRVSLFSRGSEIVVMLEGLSERGAGTVAWRDCHTTVSAGRTWTVELREAPLPENGWRESDA